MPELNPNLLRPVSRPNSDIQVKRTKKLEDGSTKEYWENIYPFIIETNNYEKYDEDNRHLYYDVDLTFKRSELGKYLNDVRTSYQDIIDDPDYKVTGDNEEEKKDNLAAADYDFCFKCHIKNIKGGQIIDYPDQELNLDKKSSHSATMQIEVDKPPKNSWDNAAFSMTFGQLSTAWSFVETISPDNDNLQVDFDYQNKFFALGLSGNYSVQKRKSSDRSLSKEALFSDQIRDVAYSKNNNWISAVELLNGLHILDSSDLSEIQHLKSSVNGYRTEFSHNNDWVAFGAFDDNVYVFETANWTQVAKLTASSDYIHAVSFSENNNYLAAGDHAGYIKIYNTSDWSLNASIEAGTRLVSVLSLDFSNDNNYIAATIRVDNLLEIYNQGSWTLEKRFTLDDTSVYNNIIESNPSVKFSRKVNYVAAGGREDGDTVHSIIFNTSDWSKEKEIDTNISEGGEDIDFNDNLLALTSASGTAAFYSVPSQAVSASPALAPTDSRALDISPELAIKTDLAKSNIASFGANGFFSSVINVADTEVQSNSLSQLLNVIGLEGVYRDKMIMDGIFREDIDIEAISRDNINTEGRWS